MIKKVVLLNDTSYENHHGCNIVVKNIEKNFNKRNVDIIYKNPIGIDWKKNKKFLKSLDIADAVIVNAEGTIHSNSEYAFSLLQIVEFTNKPCFLINMTYQNNDNKFADLVSKFKKVFVRESFSKNELMKSNIDSIIVPDLTFYKLDNELKNHRTENYVIVTDSHDLKKSKKLYDFSKKNNFSFLPLLSPVKKFSNFKSFTRVIRYYIFILIKKFQMRYKYKRFTLINNENEFLSNLNSCNLLISARFHAICLALHFSTPFIALKSNTFKIEALLNDIGLNKSRIVSMEDLNKIKSLKINVNSFSPLELENIENYIVNANKSINKMFDEIIKY